MIMGVLAASCFAFLLVRCKSRPAKSLHILATTCVVHVPFCSGAFVRQCCGVNVLECIDLS